MTSARCRTRVHAVSLATVLATTVPIFTAALPPGTGHDRVRKALPAELRSEAAIARGRDRLSAGGAGSRGFPVPDRPGS